MSLRATSLLASRGRRPTLGRASRIPTSARHSGRLDPIGGPDGTRRLVERYNALGLTRIETHYYPGARHAVLNETNRDEVQRDVLAWLAKTM